MKVRSEIRTERELSLSNLELKEKFRTGREKETESFDREWMRNGRRIDISLQGQTGGKNDCWHVSKTIKREREREKGGERKREREKGGERKRGGK